MLLKFQSSICANENYWYPIPYYYLVYINWDCIDAFCTVFLIMKNLVTVFYELEKKSYNKSHLIVIIVYNVPATNLRVLMHYISTISYHNNIIIIENVA